MIERRSKAKIPQLEIYTDGSSKTLGRTKKFGGWSFIALRDNQKIYDAAGSEVDSTNQRMELEAIRQALKYASTARRPLEKVVIYSDSAYAINCYLQEWYVQWQENGWRNASRKDVANQDLWIDIVPYFDNFWYDFKKVEGHSNILWNERCDHLAQAAAEGLRNNWRKEYE